ncbi:hypothetical protein QN277_027427 [Acacia crassicarpa]|uniref:Uncharacterized protein n=1 Tax=Acacia crassicarpa TaxID=499986 RepID=A0AAE1K620_9FABA|nr:hypothetical protein QN277_027427 [Acacia crassicarpa]
MTSSSRGPKTAFPVTEAASNYHLYPPALEKYDDVAADPKLFMQTLEKLHHSMGSKFMIPIIGGKELDLHQLFLEVTSRGGIEKIIRERRWKEITAGFKFPPTATNASFVLRKYYGSLLYHYEQIYYFKAPGWNREPSDVVQGPSPVPVPTPNVQQFLHPQVNASQLPEGTPVIGVIDGKFESGYLVTVTVGSEKLKGVLYQAPQNLALPTVLQHEQYARLKPLHHGKDREISKIIGELWNKLMEPEKAVYQEKALKDKERYQAEMEHYREKLKTGQGIGDAVPLQEQIPDKDMMDADLKVDETKGAESPQTPDKSCSGESDSEDDKGTEHNMDVDASAGMVGVGASHLGAENLSKEKEGNDDGGQHAQKMDESPSMMAV